MSLRLGSHGPDVQRAQEMLIRLGADIKADGYFGLHTDRAVREAKRRIGFFPPDGNLGHRARLALEAADDDPASDQLAKPVAVDQHTDLLLKHETIGASTVVENDVHLQQAWARQFPSIFGLPQNPADMRMSRAGLLFIEKEEELAGVTEHLHFPGGASGVTLGPGYDLGKKSSQEIVDDLTSIGVSQSTATLVAGGKGKYGRDAIEFCRANKNLVNLTASQQAGLLRHTIDKYEAIVQANLTRRLYQNEFDALTSFAYNSGGAFKHVAHALNVGRTEEAMTVISSIVTSKGVVMGGLVRRRQHEVRLFLYGKYHD